MFSISGVKCQGSGGSRCSPRSPRWWGTSAARPGCTRRSRGSGRPCRRRGESPGSCPGKSFIRSLNIFKEILCFFAIFVNPEFFTSDEAETTLGMSHNPRPHICLEAAAITREHILDWRVLGALMSVQSILPRYELSSSLVDIESILIQIYQYLPWLHLINIDYLKPSPSSCSNTNGWLSISLGLIQA